MISIDKYKDISCFLEKKTREIWEHENIIREKSGEKELEMYQYGISILDWYSEIDDEFVLYFVFNYSFLKVALENILLAIDKYPNSFGTGDAQDVIYALYRVSNLDCSKDDYVSYLQDFACCYVLYENKNVLSANILRVDLLRYMKDNETTHKKDFVGGLLHSLKHFSKDGKNLSVGNDVNDVSNMGDVLFYIGHAFIKCCQNNSKENKVEISIKDGKFMKYAFYYDKDKDTYYLNTAHRI